MHAALSFISTGPTTLDSQSRPVTPPYALLRYRMPSSTRSRIVSSLIASPSPSSSAPGGDPRRTPADSTSDGVSPQALSSITSSAAVMVARYSVTLLLFFGTSLGNAWILSNLYLSAALVRAVWGAAPG